MLLRLPQFKIQGVHWPDFVPELLADPIDPEGTTDMLKAFRAWDKRGIRFLELPSCECCGRTHHYA